MKKKYFVIFLSADGKYYNHSITLAASFADAYRRAMSFSRETHLTIMGIIEDKTLTDNFTFPDF